MIVIDEDIQALRDAEPDCLKKHLIGAWVSWMMPTSQSGGDIATGVDCRIIQCNPIEGKPKNAMVVLGVETSTEGHYVVIDQMEVVTIGPSMIPNFTIVAQPEHAEKTTAFMKDCYSKQKRPNEYWPE